MKQIKRGSYLAVMLTVSRAVNEPARPTLAVWNDAIDCRSRRWVSAPKDRVTYRRTDERMSANSNNTDDSETSWQLVTSVKAEVL